MSEVSDKEMDIECNPYDYRVGQQVMVRLKSSQGMNAIFLGYVLPFIVLLVVMIISSNYLENEGIVGLFAIASLAPYYFVLYLYRNKIKKSFTYVVYPLK